MNDEFRMQNEELQGAGWPGHKVPAAQASRVASAFARLRRDRTRPCPPPRRRLSFVKLCKALELSGGPPRASGEKLQTSKRQHPEKLQAPGGARAWAEGDLAEKHEITKQTHFKNAGIA